MACLVFLDCGCNRCVKRLYDKRNCKIAEVCEELNESKSVYVQMKEALKGLVTTMNDQCVYGNGEMLSAEESPAKQKLKGWLNRSLKIKMTDGRVLIGAFLCTDRDANVILGTCSEFLSEEHTVPRVLGSVMVPGRHIVSIHLDA